MELPNRLLILYSSQFSDSSILNIIRFLDLKVAFKGGYTGCVPFNTEYMKICEKMEIEEPGVRYCRVIEEIKGMEFGNQTLIRGHMQICCCIGDYCIA